MYNKSQLLSFSITVLPTLETLNKASLPPLSACSQICGRTETMLTAIVGWTDLTCSKLPCACNPRDQFQVKPHNAIKLKPTSHSKRSVSTKKHHSLIAVYTLYVCSVSCIKRNYTLWVNCSFFDVNAASTCSHHGTL